MTLQIVQSKSAQAFIPPTARATAVSAPQSLTDHLVSLQASHQHWSRNATIFQEGDRAHTVYRVVRGAVRLCRHTSDGRRHISDFAIPGDLIGVFCGAAQAFTAEAVTDVTLAAHTRRNIDHLSEREPLFRAKVFSYLSETLTNSQLHTFVLGCQNAKERLASFLVRMAERSGASGKGRLELPMGRQDIADHLGLTIETICRALSALKSDGVIAVPNTHQIVLRNADALRDLAEGGTAH